MHSLRHRRPRLPRPRKFKIPRLTFLSKLLSDPFEPREETEESRTDEDEVLDGDEERVEVDEVELEVEREVEPPLEEVPDLKPSTSTTPPLSLPSKFSPLLPRPWISPHRRRRHNTNSILQLAILTPSNPLPSPPSLARPLLYSTSSIPCFPFASPLSPPFASLFFRDFLT